MPPYGVRTFLQRTKKAHQRSSAIGEQFTTLKLGRKEALIARMNLLQIKTELAR
jgi:hypothetical protein